MNKGFSHIEGKVYEPYNVVMLPTKNKTDIFKALNTGTTAWLEKDKLYFLKSINKNTVDIIDGSGGVISMGHSSFLANTEPQQLHFFTDEEDIDEDIDKFVCVFKSSNGMITCLAGKENGRVKTPGNYYKIVVTTDSELNEKIDMAGTGSTYVFALPRPSNPFEEKFVKEYNKDNAIKRVLIEVNSITNTRNHTEKYLVWFPKVAEDNTVVIKPMEDKLEELANLLKEYDVRKYLNMNDFGYSTVEREIVKLFEKSNEPSPLTASAAAAIAEVAKIRISHEYNTVIKIIRAHADGGNREIDLPQSLVTKGVFAELQKDGFVCSYSFTDCKIIW